MRRLAGGSFFFVPVLLRLKGRSVSVTQSTDVAKMIIYKCIISEDEMFVDTFKMKETQNGIFYEVEGKLVTRSNKFDDQLISANASAEEVPEATEDSAVSGVDIVLNHNLRETGFKKKELIVYMKEYVKTIRAHLEQNHPERVERFVADSPAAVKMIVSDIENFQFFTGESMNPKGMVGMLNYRDDGSTPYMLFFKDGLLSEKC